MFFAVRSTNQFEEIGLWWKLTNSLQEIWPQFAKRTRTTTLSAQRPTPLSLQLVTERDAHWRGMTWLQKWAHNQQVRLVLIFEEISKQIGVHAWFGEIKIEPFLALLGAILVNVRFIQCHNIHPRSLWLILSPGWVVSLYLLVSLGVPISLFTIFSRFTSFTHIIVKPSPSKSLLELN